MANESCKARLQNLLAMLRATQIVHHTAHWQVKGPSFVGDHALFAELYTAIDKEYDKLAEKIVAKYGTEAVDAIDQLTKITTVVKRAKETDHDLMRRSLAVEEGLQVVLDAVRKHMQKEEQLSIGMDNFLQGVADAHETAVYKLQQRVGKA